MSNPYPPTPSFGAPYAGYQHNPVGIQDGGLGTHSGGGPSVPRRGSSHMAATPTQTNTTPTMNSQIFNANATVSKTAHPVPPPIPPPPFDVSPDFFKQFANSTLPPPPYPPVPIPPLGFPPFPPPAPPIFAAVSSSPQNALPNSLHPHQNKPPNVHSPHAALEHQQSSCVVTKEEGELSDGELERNSAQSMVESAQRVDADQVASSYAPHQVSSLGRERISAALSLVSAAQSISAEPEEPEVNQASERSQGAPYKARKMNNVSQRDIEVEDERMPSAGRESISSYNPPPASTPDAGEPQTNLSHHKSKDVERTQSPMHVNVGKLDGSATTVREQVKDALRSLARHNIRYNELVIEGVDSRLLRSLYEEIEHRPVHAEPLSPTLESRQVFDAQKLSRQSSQPVQNISPDAANMTVEQRKQAVITADTNSDLIPIISTSETTLPPKISDSSQALVPTTVSVEMKAVGPSLPDVAMERKDRIAQLLAAKTGKPLPSRRTPESQAQPSTKTLDLDRSVRAAETSLSLPGKPPLPSPESLVRTKNKAQTELIRQKMEALKKEALAKAQAQVTTTEASIAPSPAMATSISMAHPQQPGATAYAEAGSNGLGAQIPGLFMTGTTSPSDFDSTNGGVQESHAAPQAGEVNDPVNLNSTVTSVSPNSSASSGNHAVRSPSGHTLPMRLPQKRPLASESFSEPMSSSKRPFGRKDSHEKVEIVVSDGDSEGEVEEVEMGLDEESDDEKEAHQDTPVSAVARREGNSRNLPTSIDMSSPNSIAQATSGVATPTSTAIQTPGREQDKEELWKAKHQEIDAMRKKIAEMEERRKAKQNTRSAISPKLSEKDTLPAIRTSLVRGSRPPTLGVAEPQVTTEAERLSGEVKSPVLAASRPEELPSTPSTPLHAIKEPSKAEDLRQQLLRRKAAKEGTPSVTLMEFRQAKLAEERARLAEVKREAERREAEILEESKLLEAQLQAGLDDEAAYEEQQSNQNSRMELGLDAADPEPFESPSPKYSGTRRVDYADHSDLVTTSSASPLHGLGGAGVSTDSSPNADAAFIKPNEEGIANKGGIFAPTETSLVHDTALERESEEVPLVEATHQFVPIATAPLQGNAFSAPVGCTGETNDDPNLRLTNDKVVEEAHPDTLDPNLLGDDGSVSMSDSASEDYEPAEPNQVQDDLAENDSEPYEPADVPTSTEQAHASTLKQEEITQRTKVESQAKGLVLKEPDRQTLIDDAGGAQDVEDDMQLTVTGLGNVNEPQMIRPSHDGERTDKPWVATSHFTPYITPRRYFKSFRYHDHFPEMVSNGYKSLTFSNNIDPRKPFCPTELAGEACQDPTCEEQHFRQVALTDDKILAQMSTANNLKTKTEHERWVAGLRQVIADLRSKGVKDFHKVASALAAYRRRFSEELSTSTSASSQS